MFKQEKILIFSVIMDISIIYTLVIMTKNLDQTGQYYIVTIQ